MPEACMWSMAPAWRRAFSEPPWPSGLSAGCHACSSITLPSRVTLGTMPCAKSMVSPRGRPNQRLSSKKRSVSSWLASLVITNHGIRTP